MRTELLGRLIAARFQLESAIDKRRGMTDAAGLARTEASLGELIALQQSVALADPSDLARMHGAVLATAAAISDSAQAASAQSGPDATQRLLLTGAAARATVRSVMDGMRDFEPYLRFGSPEDEQAYRDREARNREAIEAALAKGTPQGDYEATTITYRQLLDAGAHGADKSPGYAARLATVRTSGENQREAMRANGIDTSSGDTIFRQADKDFGIAPTQVPVEKIEPNTAETELSGVAAALREAGVTGSSQTNAALTAPKTQRAERSVV